MIPWCSVGLWCGKQVVNRSSQIIVYNIQFLSDNMTDWKDKKRCCTKCLAGDQTCRDSGLCNVQQPAGRQWNTENGTQNIHTWTWSLAILKMAARPDPTRLLGDGTDLRSMLWRAPAYCCKRAVDRPSSSLSLVPVRVVHIGKNTRKWAIQICFQSASYKDGLFFVFVEER